MRFQAPRNTLKACTASQTFSERKPSAGEDSEA
jgi:hypothetical protein